MKERSYGGVNRFVFVCVCLFVCFWCWCWCVDCFPLQNKTINEDAKAAFDERDPQKSLQAHLNPEPHTQYDVLFWL